MNNDENNENNDDNFVFYKDDRGIMSGGFRIHSTLLGGGKPVMMQHATNKKQKLQSFGAKLNDFSIPFGLACSGIIGTDSVSELCENITSAPVLGEDIYEKLMRMVSANEMIKPKTKKRLINRNSNTKKNKNIKR